MRGLTQLGLLRRNADRQLTPQVVNSTIEQGHYVLMASSWVIIEPHEALSCRDASEPRPRSRSRRKLRGKHPGEPSFYPIWHGETSTAGYHRQRSDKTATVTVLGPALHPTISSGNATARFPQKFEVAERRLIRVVEWHVAPRAK